MIEDPMPIDLTPEELAELVTSDTRRRLLSGLDELMMMDPTQPYEPRVTHLIIDIAALDDDIKDHFASGNQIQDAADRLRDEHLQTNTNDVPRMQRLWRDVQYVEPSSLA